MHTSTKQKLCAYILKGTWFAHPNKKMYNNIRADKSFKQHNCVFVYLFNVLHILIENCSCFFVLPFFFPNFTLTNHVFLYSENILKTKIKETYAGNVLKTDTVDL